jgi:hypothetical protein
MGEKSNTYRLLMRKPEVVIQYGLKNVENNTRISCVRQQQQ